MKKDMIRASAVSLALLGSLALSPTRTLADGPHGVRDGGHASAPPFVPRPAVPPPGFVMNPVHPVFPAHPVHPGFPRPFVHRPFVPFGAPVTVYVAPPATNYYSAPDYYGPSGYYEPAAVHDPSATYSPSGTTVSVAPTPGVIEYSTGRYELRGDGISMPYTWVWIPNPPPPPPAAAPLAQAPGPPSAPPGATPSPARQRPLYRWTDAQGTVYWTDNWDSIPGSYRNTAQQIPSH